MRDFAPAGSAAPLPREVTVGGRSTTIQCDHSFGATLVSIAVSAKLFVPAAVGGRVTSDPVRPFVGGDVGIDPRQRKALRPGRRGAPGQCGRNVRPAAA